MPAPGSLLLLAVPRLSSPLCADTLPQRLRFAVRCLPSLAPTLRSLRSCSAPRAHTRCCRTTVNLAARSRRSLRRCVGSRAAHERPRYASGARCRRPSRPPPPHTTMVRTSSPPHPPIPRAPHETRRATRCWHPESSLTSSYRAFRGPLVSSPCHDTLPCAEAPFRSPRDASPHSPPLTLPRPSLRFCGAPCAHGRCCRTTVNLAARHDARCAGASALEPSTNHARLLSAPHAMVRTSSPHPTPPPPCTPRNATRHQVPVPGK